MAKWKDRSKVCAAPEIVESEIRLGIFRLTVHRHIHHEPDVWLASCCGLFDQAVLESKDLSEAKCQAASKVRMILEAALKNIDAGDADG
jgi:hypothetical protein